MFEIQKNIYNFSSNQLFEIAKRDNNKKRGFLFVSKLLGKHISVKPETVKTTGFLLSSLKYGFNNTSYVKCIKEYTTPNYEYHAKDDNVLVIGFCETATALGLSVAASIEGATYIATTREPICDVKQLVTFEEEHSHASTHYMYSNDINLSDYKKIILVDDEITTGNSLLHLMQTIVDKFHVEEISIMTILDWRSDEQIAKFNSFASHHNVIVNVYSLVSGKIEIDKSELYFNKHISEVKDSENIINLSIFPKIEMSFPNKKQYYLEDSGRFGITYKQICSIEDKSKDTAISISKYLESASRILVLGHGENIYIPARIASFLEQIGYEVSFKTTSRTPIYCDGTLFKDIQSFYQNGAKYHFYNRAEAETYDKVILLSEDNLNCKLCDNILIFNL